MIKFLETITALGNDVLVPIDKIELVWITYGDYGWEIHIKGIGKYEWIEYFEKDADKLHIRYQVIKNLLNGEI